MSSTKECLEGTSVHAVKGIQEQTALWMSKSALRVSDSEWGSHTHTHTHIQIVKYYWIAHVCVAACSEH